MSGGYEGLGLGLAIANRVAEKYNGSIRLENEIGSGTNCIVSLPRKRGA